MGVVVISSHVISTALPPQGDDSLQSYSVPAWGSCLHKSTGSTRSLLQHGIPKGSQPPSTISTYLNVVSSMGCKWISAPPLISMGCKGTACLSMVFTTGCRGIYTPAPGAPPLPRSSLTLVFAELFHIFLLLYPAAVFSSS